jgi:hypothetical protein
MEGTRSVGKLSLFMDFASTLSSFVSVDTGVTAFMPDGAANAPTVHN